MSGELSRWWTEAVAVAGDRLPLPLAALALLGAAALVAAGWYAWPSWLPRRRNWLAVGHRSPQLLRWARSQAARLTGAARSWLRKLWSRRWPRRRDGRAAPRRWAALPDPRDWLPTAWRRLLGLLRLLRRRRRQDPAEATGPRPAHDDVPFGPPAGLADRLAAQGRYAEAIRERLRTMIREATERGVVTDRRGWTLTEFTNATARVAPATRGVLAEAGSIFSELWYGSRPALPRHDDRMRELAGQLRTALDQARPATDRPAADRPAADPPGLLAAPRAVPMSDARPAGLEDTRW
ncbi:DUF4129 domain-containing protein [Micromonospora sp. LOL_023]|uniref:DUF4129 domain-containing protein n=1 Tax=Micromonospora sp. LOL_023 TaxID=3345418 RepID=UPI003A8AADF7